MPMVSLLRAGLALSLLAGSADGAGGSPVASVATPPAENPRSLGALSPKLYANRQRGHDFAVRRCSGCHTVGLDDGGPTEGPSFRTLAKRYGPVSLERRFAEVSAHGFDRMPPVTITRREAQDLIAYLNSLDGGSAEGITHGLP